MKTGRTEGWDERGAFAFEGEYFEWDKNDHWVGNERCPGCYLQSLRCSKDGGIRHTQYFMDDDAGFVLLEDQCDRELPDDPLLYGTSSADQMPIRVPRLSSE